MQIASHGLIAVDTQENRVLFLHPEHFAIEQILSAFPSKLHELLLLPAREKAYITLDSGAKERASHTAEHSLVVIDLRQRRISGFIGNGSLQPLHSGQAGRDGKLYFCCENSAAIVVIDPHTDSVEKVITLPSHNAHRFTLSPSGRKLFTENSDDASITVIDLCEEQGRITDTILLPGAIAAIAASPKHPYLVASAADAPLLYVVDRQSHRIRQRIILRGHQRPCQALRFSADGDRLAAIGHDEARITLFDDLLEPLGAIVTGCQPDDGCFTGDHRRFLIAHPCERALSVADLNTMRVENRLHIDAGCRTLGYFQLN